MAGRPHVLLIGIDGYDGDPTISLDGCVNDIDSMQRLLVDHVGVDRAHVQRLASPRTGVPHEGDVPESPPTLAAIRSAFTRLGDEGVVAPEDTVLVHYSGHGTQVVGLDAKGRRFSREALVPKDRVRGPKRQFLFDWELNQLLGRICERTTSVTIVLDCCCSSGATRSVMVGRPASAAAPAVASRVRFLATPADADVDGSEPPEGVGRGVARGVARFAACNVVAACLDMERARESVREGERPRGELTRALVGQLSAVPKEDLADLRWGRIWRSVLAEVRAANPRQNPWMSGSSARRVFGAGGEDAADHGLGVSVEGGKYAIDAGSLSGVTVGAEISVYGAMPLLFPPVGTADDAKACVGRLEVERADRSTAVAVARGPFVLPEGARGRMTKVGRGAMLRIALSPEDPAFLAMLRDWKSVEIVAAGEQEATLEQLADGSWALTDDVHGTGEKAGEPVLVIIPGNALGAAAPVLDHYRRYVAPLRMATACVDLPRALSLRVLDCGAADLAAAAAQEADLPELPASDDGLYEASVGAKACFVVESSADVALNVTLVDSCASGRVSVLGEKQLPARSRHVFWLRDTLGAPFAATVPGKANIGVDRLVAIGTTRSDVSLRHLETTTTFAEILAPKRRNGVARSAVPSKPPEQWTAAVAGIRIRR